MKLKVEHVLFVLLGLIVTLGIFLAVDPLDKKEKPEPGEKVLEQDGGVMVYHTFNNDFFEASESITRVFDTELCVLMYVSATGGVGAPIPLAELIESTSTALELSQYCKGNFRESAR